MQKNTRNKIVKICLAAVFSALYFVLEFLSLRLTANIKITFSGLPIMLSSFILGPLWGGISGGLGSFISQMVSYGFSATTVLWILPAILRGVSAGLIYKAFKKQPKILPIGVAAFASSIIVTAANTLAIYVDSKIYGYYTFVYVFGDTLWRFISSLATAAVYTVVSVILMKALKSEIKKLD